VGVGVASLFSFVGGLRKNGGTHTVALCDKQASLLETRPQSVKVICSLYSKTSTEVCSSPGFLKAGFYDSRSYCSGEGRN
jgi:hypothetical protein